MTVDMIWPFRENYVAKCNNCGFTWDMEYVGYYPRSEYHIDHCSHYCMDAVINDKPEPDQVYVIINEDDNVALMAKAYDEDHMWMLFTITFNMLERNMASEGGPVEFSIKENLMFTHKCIHLGELYDVLKRLEHFRK